MGVRVAVAGATGYAGGELLRLLSGHPDLDITAVTGHSSAGELLGSVHPQLRSLAHLVVGATDAASLTDADLVFLALPHGESAAIAAHLPASVKIVDLGADHRLQDAAAWTAYYGGAHSGAWTYGLPELPGARVAIGAADRVAAPGCYATAVSLALAPLIAAGIADPNDVVVIAASGTSGAGKGAKAHLNASEVMGEISAYKVGTHQHVPEIKQATGAASLSMTPLLAPMPRGILATVTAKPLVGGGDAAQALYEIYHDEPFVHVLPDGTWPRTGSTLGSNSCHLQVGYDRDSRRIIAMSAIDNLGKGAAGQAIQCANLMLGLPETTGLAVDGVAP
ncbi:MAG TPA: N-acetyl-gamma-glutamyl-phosphate reductase [Micromonosporaceae bacterium]